MPTGEENKEIVRRFIEEVQSGHNVAAIDDYFAPNFVDHTAPPGSVGDRDSAKHFFTLVFAAFPDLHVTILDLIAEGDLVVTRKTFRGTHRGEFMGIPPTGKQVEYEVIDIRTIAGDGKMTDHWAMSDQLGMMQQLGVIPAQE